MFEHTVVASIYVAVNCGMALSDCMLAYSDQTATVLFARLTHGPCGSMQCWAQDKGCILFVLHDMTSITHACKTDANTSRRPSL